MSFIRAETSERHAYLDAIISETEYNLATNDGVRRIFGDKRFRPLQYARGLFVPNMRHGLMTIPREYQDHGTPIIALRRDETAIFGRGFGRMTARQVESLYAELAAMRQREVGRIMLSGKQITAFLRDKEGQSALLGVRPTDNAMTGSIGTAVVPAEAATGNIETVYAAMGRPLIAIFPDRSGNFRPQSSSTTKAMHEIHHVVQMNENPLLEIRLNAVDEVILGIELEAYQQEVAYAGGLAISTDPRYSGNPSILARNALEVVNIRNRYKDNTIPDKTNPAILSALRESNLIDFTFSS